MVRRASSNCGAGEVLKKVEQNRELWELFTKKEEYDASLLDKYGRFPYYLSRQRNVFGPEVSEFLLKNRLSPEYPAGKEFAVCLTHDIDFICTDMLNTAARTVKALKNGQFAEASVLPFSRINKTRSPLWNFRWIMELEERYKAKSTFYFLALNPRNEDFTFSIEKLDGELNFILEDGWEISVHGGHEAYNNPIEIKRKNEEWEKSSENWSLRLNAVKGC